MIKYIFSVLMLLLFTQKSYSQCDHEFTITCKRGFTLTDGERVEEANIDASIIIITKDNITLTGVIGGEEGTAVSDIEETTVCNWKNLW